MKKFTILFLVILTAIGTIQAQWPGVQKNFCRNGLNILINDHSTIRDSVLVSEGNAFRVLDVNVIIDTVIHTWVSDLRMYLQKGSTGVKILNNVGGSGDNIINAILDDSAGVIIPPPVLTGRFRPSNPLFPFNNLPTDGYWKLVVTDTNTGDTGSLRAWCVQITYWVPAAPVQILKCRNGLNKLIGPQQTTRDSILISNIGQPCIVNDVNIKIDSLLHTWNADVQVYVQKGLTGVKIINQVGGSGDNFIGTTLNDSASIPISSGTAPFTGTFRPSNSLISFNGIVAEGYWRIVITDTGCCDIGALKAWCVQVTFNCPTGGIKTIEIPNHYLLSQNYPNPFNPVTKIKYGLPENAFVKLVVYDILGREVAVLVNEQKSANTYEVEFDASNLPSGVYFYRLNAGDVSLTKKMLLVK